MIRLQVATQPLDYEDLTLADRKNKGRKTALFALGLGAVAALETANHLGKKRAKNKLWKREIRKQDVAGILTAPFPFDAMRYNDSRRARQLEIVAKKPDLKYRYRNWVPNKDREVFLDYLQKIWGACAPTSIDDFNSMISNNEYFGAAYLDEKPAAFLRIMWRKTNGVFSPDVFGTFEKLTKNYTWIPDEDGDTLIFVDYTSLIERGGIGPTFIEHVYKTVLPRFETAVEMPHIATYSPKTDGALNLHENVAIGSRKKLWLGPEIEDARPKWPEKFPHPEPRDYTRDVRVVVYKGFEGVRREHYNPNRLVFWL